MKASPTHSRFRERRSEGYPLPTTSPAEHIPPYLQSPEGALAPFPELTNLPPEVRAHKRGKHRSVMPKREFALERAEWRGGSSRLGPMGRNSPLVHVHEHRLHSRGR